MTEKIKLKKGQTIYCYKVLPYGRSGRRVVIDDSSGHSVYVRLTKKDSAYQNKEPHQDYWQIMWKDIRII